MVESKLKCNFHVDMVHSTMTFSPDSRSPLLHTGLASCAGRTLSCPDRDGLSCSQCHDKRIKVMALLGSPKSFAQRGTHLKISASTIDSQLPSFFNLKITFNRGTSRVRNLLTIISNVQVELAAEHHLSASIGNSVGVLGDHGVYESCRAEVC